MDRGGGSQDARHAAVARRRRAHAGVGPQHGAGLPVGGLGGEDRSRDPGRPPDSGAGLEPAFWAPDRAEPREAGAPPVSGAPRQPTAAGVRLSASSTARQNAGRSPGTRDVMRLPSTTTGSSD